MKTNQNIFVQTKDEAPPGGGVGGGQGGARGEEGASQAAEGNAELDGSEGG